MRRAARRGRRRQAGDRGWWEGEVNATYVATFFSSQSPFLVPFLSSPFLFGSRATCRLLCARLGLAIPANRRERLDEARGRGLEVNRRGSGLYFVQVSRCPVHCLHRLRKAA